MKYYAATTILSNVLNWAFNYTVTMGQMDKMFVGFTFVYCFGNVKHSSSFSIKYTGPKDNCYVIVSYI